jgi:serine acetyltransferase
VVIDDVSAGVLVAGAPARVVAEKSSDEILGLK